MICPACGHALVPLEIDGLTIDVCQDGCAGMWFDRNELRSFDDPAAAAGQLLIERAGRPRVPVDLSRRRRCPTCPDSVLMRHFFSAKRAVTVDECPTCAGIWLDAGELERIRMEYASSGARAQAAHIALEEVLAGDRMTLLRSQLDDALPYDTFRSRVASALLIAGYVIAAFGLRGAGFAARMFYQSAVPWACVCFPDAFAGAISPIFGTTRRSARSFVWFFGWLVLLLPLLQIAIIWTMLN
jgi:hypothetical protein